MKSALTLMVVVVLACGAYCQPQPIPFYPLTILFDSDAPQKGVAVFEPFPDRPRLMLAERVSITNESNKVTVTIEGLTMLTQDSSGIRTVTVGRYPCTFTPDYEILINDHAVTAAEAAKLDPVIPCQQAIQSDGRSVSPPRTQRGILGPSTLNTGLEPIVYPVQSGDTLTRVCELFLITPEHLRKANPHLTLRQDLTGIRLLRIPEPGEKAEEAEQTAGEDAVPDAPQP